MRKSNSVALAAAAALILSATMPSAAETMRLSQLKRADLVALQREQSVADGACAAALVNEIDAYGGPEAMREFTIDVEASPIVIESTARGVSHECRDGVHTITENGKDLILQKYDENGGPTMQEP